MTFFANFATHLLIASVLSVPTAPAVVAGPQEEELETVAEVVETMIERYVGMWYRDFTQTTDDEVRFLLTDL